MTSLVSSYVVGSLEIGVALVIMITEAVRIKRCGSEQRLFVQLSIISLVSGLFNCFVEIKNQNICTLQGMIVTWKLMNVYGIYYVLLKRIIYQPQVMRLRSSEAWMINQWATVTAILPAVFGMYQWTLTTCWIETDDLPGQLLEVFLVAGISITMVVYGLVLYCRRLVNKSNLTQSFAKSIETNDLKSLSTTRIYRYCLSYFAL